VLVRLVDEDGVVFFTNATSRKGRQLAANPRVALTSVWTSLRRQVRIEGVAEAATAGESDAYWRSRPHGSRLGALASPQSRPISRETLEARHRELAAQYPEGSDIPRPEWWGGVRVRPHRLEFWQGREHRLHDRIAFERDGDEWRAVRLAP
jgi:pyridoxamine 5'-phosphate oxidase